MPTDSNESLNWFDAESYCKSLGGHLASLSTLNQVLSLIRIQTLTSSIWIGLNNVDKNAGYQWSDGSGVGYYYWDFGLFIKYFNLS